MYLKRLEMFGFKSFADKTVVSFEPGITAIVGPNGCGKSNISDSIRWVLGEKSYKMLRGEKMEDMIFNGTEFRKPLGFCEVSMVFSNEDKTLPVEFAEVEITRKYFRGGESEYYINRALCRQKDVYDLLMDTGVGSNTYSMVEQGRIDYIVRATPDERRFLIEEAAGISKYKSKKEEALRKLERTEYNLLRINDIVAEVEKNIKYAERQARKAERFKEQYDTLKRFETYKAIKDIEQLTAERGSAEERKVSLETRQNELSAQVAAAREQVTAQSAEIDRLNSVLSSTEEEKYKHLNEIDKLRSKMEFNTIRCAELNARNATNAATSEETHQKIALNSEKIAQREHEYAAFQDEKLRVDASFKEKKQLLETIMAEIAHDAQQIDVHERELSLSASVLNTIRADISQCVMEIAKLEHQLTRIAAEMEKLIQERKEQERALIDKQTLLEQQRGEFITATQHYENSKALKNERELELERTRESILNKRVTVKEMEARLRVLEDLEKNYSGFKEGAKKSLQLKDAAEPLFQSITTLVSSLNVHEGFENAIQAILADRIYAVIAQSHKDAYDIIKHLKENNLGQITILVNRADIDEEQCAVPYDPNFIFGRAIDFVTVTEANRYIVHELFRDTLIIENTVEEFYDEIVELSRHFRLVTKDGLVIGPSVYVSGGSDSESNAEMLTRDRKIKELQAKIAEDHQGLQLLTSHENSLVGQLGDIRAELDHFEKNFYDRKVQIETTEHISRSVANITQKIDMQLDLLAREQREHQEHIARLGNNRCEKETTLSEKETRHRLLQTSLEQERARAREKIPLKENAQMELAGLTATVNGLMEKDAFMAHAIAALQTTVAEDTRAIERLQQEICANSNSIQHCTAENNEVHGMLAQTENALRGIESVLARMHIERDTAAAAFQDLQSGVNRLNVELESCREEIHEISMKSMDLSYRENAISDRLRQTYKVDIAALDASTIILTEEESASLDARILELQGKVEAMGQVNLMAVEEYDTLRARYEFLTTQKNDLEKARETLLEAVRKINRTTKTLFLDVFELVKKFFNEYYQVLFKGGTADLMLLDGENPLESGIDIYVRPPGKKLQNISLLSGGEKALTAIALLFAVFKVKPSPYCVLDEIDAPLDEANIDRFLTVVQEFTSTTQFLIVTHNRKTISTAQTLFGITMEEAGVSKIVSVRLGEEDKFIDDGKKKDKRDSIYKPQKKVNFEKIDQLVGVQNSQESPVSTENPAAPSTE